MAELTISLGPFSVDFPENISLNIIKDKIEVNPVVLGNTNANFFRFFQHCCQVYKYSWKKLTSRGCTCFIVALIIFILISQIITMNRSKA